MLCRVYTYIYTINNILCAKIFRSWWLDGGRTWGRQLAVCYQPTTPQNKANGTWVEIMPGLECWQSWPSWYIRSIHIYVVIVHQMWATNLFLVARTAAALACVDTKLINKTSSHISGDFWVPSLLLVLGSLALAMALPSALCIGYHPWLDLGSERNESPMPFAVCISLSH